MQYHIRRLAAVFLTLSLGLCACQGSWNLTDRIGFKPGEDQVTVSTPETISIESETDMETEAVTSTDANAEPVVVRVGQAKDSVETPATQAVYNDENNPAPGLNTDKQIIMIGDSRTVGMYCALTYPENEWEKHIFYNISETDYTGSAYNTTFVARGGEGYSFLETYGLALALTHVTPNSVLVFWLGVNDTYNADKYINYLNGAALASGVPVYVLTVGPVTGDSKYITEAGVEAMNEKLRTSLDPQIHLIDAFSFLQEGLSEGLIATIDKVHYTYDSCRLIYRFLQEAIAADS